MIFGLFLAEENFFSLRDREPSYNGHCVGVTRTNWLNNGVGTCSDIDNCNR